MKKTYKLYNLEINFFHKKLLNYIIQKYSRLENVKIIF